MEAIKIDHHINHYFGTGFVDLSKNFGNINLDFQKLKEDLSSKVIDIPLGGFNILKINDSLIICLHRKT
jgi:hypothetical protein